MDLPMNQDKLKNLIASIPTEQLKSDEIEPFIQQMRKHLIEQALQGEMDAHLGYDRYERHSGTNSRNGSSKKTLKTEKGPIAISVPRDRDGSFEPQIVPKVEFSGDWDPSLNLINPNSGCFLSGCHEDIGDISFGIFIFQDIKINRFKDPIVKWNLLRNSEIR